MNAILLLPFLRQLVRELSAAAFSAFARWLLAWAALHPSFAEERTPTSYRVWVEPSAGPVLISYEDFFGDENYGWMRNIQVYWNSTAGIPTAAIMDDGGEVRLQIGGRQ